jgi:hypothetical protein
MGNCSRASLARAAVACAVAAGLWMGMAPAAQAALISENSSYGADTLTLDTATNLEWLDLTLTQNRSFNDISGQLGSAGQFAGFHYATQADVHTLFLDAGFSVEPGTIASSTNPPDLAAGATLLSLLGETSDVLFPGGGEDYGFYGYIAPISADQIDGAYLLFETPCGRDPACVWYYALGFQAIPASTAGNDVNATYGSLLVRDAPAPAPVPEPASLSVFGAALTGFWMARRRHRGAA